MVVTWPFLLCHMTSQAKRHWLQRGGRLWTSCCRYSNSIETWTRRKPGLGMGTCTVHAHVCVGGKGGGCVGVWVCVYMYVQVKQCVHVISACLYIHVRVHGIYILTWHLMARSSVLNEEARYKKAWPGNLSACEYIQNIVMAGSLRLSSLLKIVYYYSLTVHRL